MGCDATGLAKLTENHTSNTEVSYGLDEACTPSGAAR